MNITFSNNCFSIRNNEGVSCANIKTNVDTFDNILSLFLTLEGEKKRVRKIRFEK